MPAMSQYRPLSRSRARRRRGHAHAFRHAEGAAPAVRPPDGAARRRRARRAPARAHRGGRRPRRRARHQDAAGAARHRGAGRVRRAARAARHRRRGRASALTVFADDLDAEDDILVLPGDAPLLRAETLARLATEHRAAGRRRDDPHRARRRPDRATAGSCATRTAGSTRIVEQADATAEELEIDEVNTSIYCFRRGLLAPALRRLEPRERAGRVLPHRRRSRCCAQAGHNVIARRGRGPGRGVSVNDRAQLADAEAELRRRINARWMRDGRHDGRSRRAPTSTPRSSSSPTCGCSRARSSRAAPSSAPARSIGPDCHLVDTVVGERCAIVASTVARECRDRRRLRRRPVRVAAARHPPRRRRAGRHVRRDQELRDRRGHQGAAPLLRRRRRDRRRRQHRRRARSPPTTTASDKHRTKIGDGRAHRRRTRSLVAPVEVGDGAVHRRGRGRDPRRAAGRAGQGRARRDRRGLGREARGCRRPTTGDDRGGGRS